MSLGHERPERVEWTVCRFERFAAVMLAVDLPAFRVLSLLCLSVCLSPTTGSADEERIQFLERYCLDCHTGPAADGELDLQSLRIDFETAGNFAQWVGILQRIANLEMPPSDAEAQPSREQRSHFCESLHQTLVEADRLRIERSGRSPIRRLNRHEFHHSLREILAIPNLNLLEMLPPDGSDFGYDKSSSALDFSKVHVSQWLEMVDAALQQAITPMVERPRSRTVRASLTSVEGVRETCQGLFAQLKQGRVIPMIGMRADPTLNVVRGNFQRRDPGSVTDPAPHFDGLAMFINGESNLGMAIKPFRMEVPGYYKIRVHGFGIQNDRGKLSPSTRLETVGFYTDDRTLGYVDLPSDRPTTAELTVWLEPKDRIKPLVASSTYPIIRVGGLGKDSWKSITGNGVVFQWFELEGPLVEQWPPESHRRLFGNLAIQSISSVPAANKSSPGPDKVVAAVAVRSANPSQDAKRLIRRMAQRAIRRPIQAADLQLPMEIADEKLRNGSSFQEAVLAAYRALLCSPPMLLLEENVGELNPHALASRLAYFLWNSPPDAALRELANQNELQGQRLHEQVDRLLDDPRSERFVEHFLDHWLSLKDIELTQPDENLYPEFNPLLLDAMLLETRTYFAEMLRSDLDVTHVVDSDFTFLNGRLADLYGMDGIQGSEMRRVQLPRELHRGGLLTQASLLKVTANGTTTSPVTRGTFVLTKLLGDPPPAPPASVPAVEPDISGATTIREQLAKHREVESCAMCHQKIDPPGFALESFDVMGGYRIRYRSIKDGDPIKGLLMHGGKPSGVREALPVDSSGQLPDGSHFKNIEQFRELLLTQRDQLNENVMKQLIIYATGSPVGIADQQEFDRMMGSLRESEGGLRSMIHLIVDSTLFRHK